MEISNALGSIIKMDQSIYFSDEICKLRRIGELDKRSSIFNLNPFIDAKGILRVGGRLKNSFLSFDQKHPVILTEKAS